jgi:hypothetical protein
MSTKNTARLFINTLGDTNCCQPIGDFCMSIRARMFAEVTQIPSRYASASIQDIMDMSSSPRRAKIGQHDNLHKVSVHGINCGFKSLELARMVAEAMADDLGVDTDCEEFRTEIFHPVA